MTDQILSSITLTDDFQQISDEYKRFKHNMYDKMCECNQQSLDIIEKELIKSITSLLQASDTTAQEDNRIRALIGVITLSKYSLINQEECANMFSKIVSTFPQSIQKRLFLFKYISKLCKKAPNYIWDKYLKQVQNKIFPMKNKQPIEIQSIENALLYVNFLIQNSPNFLSQFSKEIFLHLLKIVKENEYTFDLNYDILAKTNNKTMIEYFSCNRKFYANNAIELIRKILIKIKSIRYQMIKVSNVLIPEHNEKMKYLALLSVLLQTCGKPFVEQNYDSIMEFLTNEEDDQKTQILIARNLIYCLKPNEDIGELLYNYLFLLSDNRYGNDDDYIDIICGRLQNLKLLLFLNHGKGNLQQIYEKAMNYINDEEDRISLCALDLLNTFCLAINEEEKMNFGFEQFLTDQEELNKSIFQFVELANLKFDSDPLLFVDELSSFITNDPLETLLFLNDNKIIEAEKDDDDDDVDVINYNEYRSNDGNYIIQSLKDRSIINGKVFKEKIITPVFNSISNTNGDVRSLVPLVLIKLSPKEFFTQNHLQVFIDHLLNDAENQVKLAILQSFNYSLTLPYNHNGGDDDDDDDNDNEEEDDDDRIDCNAFVNSIDGSLDNIFNSLILNNTNSQIIEKESIKFVCSMAKKSESISFKILDKFRDLYSEFSKENDYSILQKKISINSQYLPFVIDVLPSFYNTNFESFFNFLFGFMNMKIQSKSMFQLNFFETMFCSYSKIFQIILRNSPTLIDPYIDQMIKFCIKCLYYGLSELETRNILSLLGKCLYHIGLERTIKINEQKLFDEQTNLYKIVFNTGTHFVSPIISKLILKILSFIGIQNLYEKSPIVNLETGWKSNITYDISKCKEIASCKRIVYLICSDLLFKILDDQSMSNIHLKALQILLTVLKKSDLKSNEYKIVQIELEKIFTYFKNMLDNCCSDDQKGEFVPFLGTFVEFELPNIQNISKDLIKYLIELWDYGSSSSLLLFVNNLKTNLFPYLNQIVPRVFDLENKVTLLSSIQINCIIFNSTETLTFDIIQFLINMANEGNYEALNGLSETILSSYLPDKYIPSIIQMCLKTISENNGYFNDSIKVLRILRAKAKMFKESEMIFNENFPLISNSLKSFPNEMNLIINADFEQIKKEMTKSGNRSNRKCISELIDKKDEFLDLVTSIRNCISSDDNSIYIQQWLNDLIIFCIQESPNAIIKSLLPIVQINSSFALSLFNISFFIFLKKFEVIPKKYAKNKTTQSKQKSMSKDSNHTFISIMNDPRLNAKIQPKKQTGLVIIDGSKKQTEQSKGMAIPLEEQKPKENTIKDEIAPITQTFFDLLMMENLPSQCRTIISNLIEFADRAGIPIFDENDFKSLRRPLSTLFSNNPPLSLRFALLNYSKNMDDLKEKAALDLEQAYLNNGFFEQCQNFRNLNQTNQSDNNNYLIPIQANTVENIYRLQSAFKFFEMKNWDGFNNEIELMNHNSISHLFKAASLIQQYWEKNKNEQNTNLLNNDSIEFFDSEKVRILNEIEMAFNSLGDENRASFSHSISTINQSILYGEQLIELQEMLFSNGNLNNSMLRILNSNQITNFLHSILLLRIASKGDNKNSLAEKVELLSICRRSMNWNLMNKYYNHFFGSMPNVPIEIQYEMMYNKLVNGYATEIEINNLLENIQDLIKQNKTSSLLITKNDEYEYPNLLKNIQYQKALFYSNNNNDSSKFKEVLNLCKNLNSSKAINLWSWANLKLFEIENEIDYFKPKFQYKSFKVKSHNRQKNEDLESQNTDNLRTFKSKSINYGYLIDAIKGYIKSELLNDKMAGPNMLLIVSLLFNHLSINGNKIINDIKEILQELPLHFYLESVPIIISYIHQLNKDDFGEFIIDLLIKLMKKYPRGVIYEYSFSLFCDKRKVSDEKVLPSPIEDVKNYFLIQGNSEELRRQNCQNIFNEVHDLTVNLYKMSTNIILITSNFVNYILHFLSIEQKRPHSDDEIDSFIDDLNFMKDEYFLPLKLYMLNVRDLNENVYDPNNNEKEYINDASIKESLMRMTSKIDDVICSLLQLIDNRTSLKEITNAVSIMEKNLHRIKLKTQKRPPRKKQQQQEEEQQEEQQQEQQQQQEEEQQEEEQQEEEQQEEQQQQQEEQQQQQEEQEQQQKKVEMQKKIEIKRLISSENPESSNIRLLEVVDDDKKCDQLGVSDSLEYEGTMSFSSLDNIEMAMPHVFVDNDSNKISHAKFKILKHKSHIKKKDMNQKYESLKKQMKRIQSKFNTASDEIYGKHSLYTNLYSFKEKLKEKIDSMKTNHDIEIENPGMLEKIQNLSLPIFGTFRYDEEKPILIEKFDKNCEDFVSLARPKRIYIYGSDGKKYSFILKTTEDLRVDQRNMILFKFLNRFLKTKIRTYSVTPLTVQIGIMQFIEKSESISSLVHANRARNYVNKNAEENIIKQNFLNKEEKYDDITYDRKYSIVKYLIDNTPDLSHDLSESMYFLAPNSETWTKYTLNFTKTCAVTSIVGYIIGIGDRHTNNILVSMIDGSVVHIDFTDCFEVDQRRLYQAEKVPFRLTRNIVSMFGPCGYNGTFRSTCEETLALIRENREMIFNILEVFYISPIQNYGSVRDMRRNLSEVKVSSCKNKFIMKRIKMKLDGTDSTIIYDENVVKKPIIENAVSVHEQVDKLISHASNYNNLACAYSGWQPWI